MAVILVPFLFDISTVSENCGTCAFSAGLCSTVCVVYLLSGMLNRSSVHLWVTTAKRLIHSSMSVDCRLPPPPLTSTTVDKIWILVLPPLLLLILFPCWLHVSSTWPLLAIYYGNDGDRGEVAGMSRGKWKWGSEASLPSRNVQELFHQYQPLIELPPTILPHVTRQVRFFLTSTRLWLTIFCLETTSSHSFLSLFLYQWSTSTPTLRKPSCAKQ